MSDGYLGLYQGTVADNVDPTGVHAVKCLIPSILGGQVSGWCQPIYPAVTSPKVNEVVWIHFVNGDLTKPVYFSSGEIDAAQITAGTISADRVEATDIYGHIFSTASGPTDTTTYPRIVLDPTTEAMVVEPAHNNYGGVFGSYSDDGSGSTSSELIIAAPYTHSDTPHYVIDPSATASIRLGYYTGHDFDAYPIRISSSVDLQGWLRPQALVFSTALEGFPLISNILHGSFSTGSVTVGSTVTGAIAFSDGLSAYTFPEVDGESPTVTLTLDNEDPAHAVQAFDLDIRLLAVNASGFSWAVKNNGSASRTSNVQWIAIGS